MATVTGNIIGNRKIPNDIFAYSIDQQSSRVIEESSQRMIKNIKI
jgi:hypothetical protein